MTSQTHSAPSTCQFKQTTPSHQLWFVPELCTSSTKIRLCHSSSVREVSEPLSTSPGLATHLALLGVRSAQDVVRALRQETPTTHTGVAALPATWDHSAWRSTSASTSRVSTEVPASTEPVTTSACAQQVCTLLFCLVFVPCYGVASDFLCCACSVTAWDNFPFLKYNGLHSICSNQLCSRFCQRTFSVHMCLEHQYTERS